MKKIRSNKRGIRIHSPFVYHLVTSVLFASSKFDDFEENNLQKRSRSEKKQLMFLLRLISHFRPVNVFYSENMSAEDLSLLKNISTESVFTIFDSQGLEQLAQEGIQPCFYILNRMPEINSAVLPDHSICFFRKKLSGENVNSLLKLLAENEKGIILIELKNEDLIIFDSKFLSQHYVIK